MAKLGLLKGVAVALATLGMTFPHPRIVAAEQKVPTRPTIKFVAANSILDVKLDKEGSFTGRTINQNGTPVVGAKVAIKQGKTEMGHAVTDQKGNFALPNLKAGLYEVQSGATVGFYRVWSENTAPPSAKPHGLLVMGENGARGQYGLTETIAGENLGLILLVATTGLALSALIVALNAKHESRSANDTANRALNQAKSP